MWIGTGLVEQHDRTGRAEFDVSAGHVRLVVWREIVHNGAARTQFFDRVSIVPASGTGGEVAVTSREEEIPGGISRQSPATLPDAAFRTVGGRTVSHHLLEGGSVVRDNPAVIDRVVSVRSESKIDDPAGQQKPGALVFAKRVEGDSRSSVTRSGHAGLNYDRATGFLGARSDVERMQPLEISCALFRFGDYVQRPAIGINDGGAGNADFRGDVTAFRNIVARNGRGSADQETNFPERRGSQSVGVVCVDAIVFRGDIDDVVEALPRDAYVCDIQRRRVGEAVHRVGEELAKLCLVNIGRI